MRRILNLYKEIGETPLERMERFVKENPEYDNVPMTYAGRLDPMAEGVLLVLTADEVHKKKYFNGLSKIYETEFLFGIGTDTFDLLGKITEIQDEVDLQFGKILEYLPKFKGVQEQKLPPFASDKYKGTPLWQLAREGKIGPDETPTKEITIESIEMQKMSEISKEDLSNEVERRIKSVTGDFRQKELMMTWEEALRKSKIEKFPLLRLKIECSTGTYVRRIAYDLGKMVGTPALAFSIKRTAVGSYRIEDSV